MINKMSTGHNVATASLGTLDPIPHVDPVMPVDREYSISGKANDIGFYTCFHYDMVQDESEYLAILTAWGIATINQADVTIYCRNQRMVGTRYNGTALLPEMGQDAKYEGGFPKNIAIYVVDLEELVG